jgi:hypothetical protein
VRREILKVFIFDGCMPLWEFLDFNYRGSGCILVLFLYCVAYNHAYLSVSSDVVASSIVLCDICSNNTPCRIVLQLLYCVARRCIVVKKVITLNQIRIHGHPLLCVVVYCDSLAGFDLTLHTEFIKFIPRKLNSTYKLHTYQVYTRFEYTT